MTRWNETMICLPSDNREVKIYDRSYGTLHATYDESSRQWSESGTKNLPCGWSLYPIYWMEVTEEPKEKQDVRTVKQDV